MAQGQAVEGECGVVRVNSCLCWGRTIDKVQEVGVFLASILDLSIFDR